MALLPDSSAIYLGLPVSGGICCAAALWLLRRRAPEAPLLLWVGASALQTAAVALAFLSARAPGALGMGAAVATQGLVLLLIGLATQRTAAWMERQNQRARILTGEIERLIDQRMQDADVDRLTGLLNQSALAKRTEGREFFRGVVAVCDIDNFKHMNDRFGHLVGDEILRNIGQLMRASIRPQDEAFRWGGDEFVVLFHNQNREIVRKRMQDVAQRLRSFQVRGEGIVPLSFSWGTAEGYGRTLRDTLDAADQEMYGLKRKRRRQTGEPAGSAEATGG